MTPAPDFFKIREFKRDRRDLERSLRKEVNRYSDLSEKGRTYDLKAIELRIEKIRSDIKSIEILLKDSWIDEGKDRNGKKESEEESG